MRLEAGLHLALASGELRDRALEQTHPLWGAAVSLAEYRRRTAEAMDTAWGHENYHLYVVLGPNGDVQASCKVYELPMWALGRPVRTIGLGAVFTAPEHRRAGIATRMLKALMARYADRGFRLATLFSDVAPTLYERLGFRQLASKTYQAARDLMPPPPADAIWRRPTPMDAAILADIQEGTARSFSLSYGRTPGLWAFELARGEATLLVLEQQGEIAGYAALSTHQDQLWLQDWGARSASCAAAIVRTALTWSREAKVLCGWLPEGAPAADLPFAVEDRERALWMVAPLGDDPPPLPALLAGPHHAWALEHF
ncbi:MAG: GNAT family N-acetyltransferase [Cyanobacteria bacterium REEB65]|nr:GNAT family N-acetyltransferase [Cyanobacteria bacterium REEB65]